MTKETLKLALEAMEYADACLKKQLTTKDKHEYAQDLLLEAGTAIKEALANEALEKMAENARELGLDYEPAQKPCGGCKGSGWVTRDPDIGTDQECFVCGGSGVYPKEPEHGWTPERIAGMARLKEAQDKKLAQPEQHQDWCASLTQMLMSMPPKPAPCNCKPKPEQEPTTKAGELRAMKTELWKQPEQEPVAWRIRCTDPMRDWVLMYRYPKTEEQFSNMEIQSLYTTPPQRKPLTDEEIETYRHMIDWTAHWSYINFARAIEAAHGIKENT